MGTGFGIEEKKKGGGGGKERGEEEGRESREKKDKPPQKSTERRQTSLRFPWLRDSIRCTFSNIHFFFSLSFPPPRLFCTERRQYRFSLPPPPPSSQPLPIPMRRLFSFRPGEGGGWEEGRRAPWRYEGRIQRYQTAAKQILVCAPLYFQGWAPRDGGDEDGTLILSIPTKKEMRGKKMRSFHPCAFPACGIYTG